MKVYFENGITVIDTGDPVGGCQNKHGHNGVLCVKAEKKYKSVVYYKKTRYYLGTFEDVETTAARYKEAKQRIENGTFLEWYQSLYGEKKRIRKRKESETK